MKLKQTGVVALLILLVFSLSGCIGINNNFKQIRNQLLAGSKDKFESEIEFSVGKFGLKFAGSFVKFADTDVNVDEMLDQISFIQVGVYNRTKSKSFQPSNIGLKQLGRKLNENGWRYIVKNISNDEITTVFLNKNNEGQLNRILVVNYSDDELVLAEVSGNLEKLIQQAIKDNGIRFEISDN